MSALPKLLSGPERLERWPLARRSVRMGNPEALSVGVRDRALELARAGKKAETLAFVEHLHPGNLRVVEVTFEWCVRVFDELSERRGEATALATAAEIEEAWSRIAITDPERPAFPPLVERLTPAWFGTMRDEYLTRKRTKSLHLPEPALTATLESLRTGVEGVFASGPDAAAAAVRAYLEHARHVHDAQIDWIWAASEVIAAREGDDFVEEILNAAFEQTPPVNLLWPALHALSAEEAAFALAEHLRAHFSGPDRSSAVRILDEPDRIRLVLDPCGSGGAVRRRLAGSGFRDHGLRRTPKNTAWGQSGVPFYCMQCAHMELRSAQAIGFPRWVTEYQADPAQPCGWTLYKRPETIPESYFTRLGLKKDPRNFRWTGGVVGRLRALAGLVEATWRAR